MGIGYNIHLATVMPVSETPGSYCLEPILKVILCIFYFEPTILAPSSIKIELIELPTNNLIISIIDIVRSWIKAVTQS